MVIGKKGQAAVTDALIFMMICSGAASLLAYVAGLYGTSTNEQMLTIYNYEFAGTALVSLHYAEDDDGHRFMVKVKEKLAKVTASDPTPITDYLDGLAHDSVWDKLYKASPTATITLCFKSGTGNEICYPSAGSSMIQRIFTSSVSLKDDNNKQWTMAIKLYY